MSTDLAALADDVILYRDIVNGLNSKEQSDKLRFKKSVDPYPVLVEVIKEARKQNKPTTLGYLKLRMKDRIEGFDETTLKDNKGRSFKRFKDFVIEAIHRGLVKLKTSGTANEVFLPDEELNNENHEVEKSDTETKENLTKNDRSKNISFFLHYVNVSFMTLIEHQSHQFLFQ
jgi:hypothetical protein